MTAPLPADLTESQLGTVGRQLGSGAQARIHDLPNLTLPDAPGPLVYKKYKPGKAPQHSVATIVGLRTRLLSDPARLSRLDATTTWPIRQVLANGAVAGLVLAKIPDTFFHDQHLPSGKIDHKPREVQFLFMPPDRALQGKLPTPTPTERLTICRDFAGALAFLHGDMHVVFGDINARNAVFRLGTEPTLMFVDCDAVRTIGSVAAMAQLNSPDWDPPEGNVLSVSTDCYKLGLFVLRCLTPGQGCSVNRDPNIARGVLDARGLALLNQAIRGPADQRPTAETWHRYLRRALGEALAPPKLDRAEVDRTIVPAGEPVVVRWAADEADTVEVTGVGVPAPVIVSGIAGSGTIDVHPTRTGQLTVTARNQLGEDSARTGPVAVFDVPSFDDLLVPMPRLDLPDLTPRALPSVAAVLPEFPAGEPVAPPSLVAAIGTWPEPELPPQEFIDVAGPPPAAALGIPDIPVDITAIMSGLPGFGADQNGGD